MKYKIKMNYLISLKRATVLRPDGHGLEHVEIAPRYINVVAYCVLVIGRPKGALRA